jgi:hypothetical protein
VTKNLFPMGGGTTFFWQRAAVGQFY